jgi:NAD(P)-dependent dehydrogenase (short-subunit alcohol dehydrogenase family)
MNSSNFLWGYVNNAAIYFPSTKESSRLSDIRLNGMMEILEVNMISAFLLSREMFKWMKETRKGGSIVFISSFVNSRGSLINPVYAMTKAAIVNLAKSIASEGGEDNIRCNAISPGVMETQMSSEIYKSEEILRKRIERNLIKRTCTTEEVAHLVKYLLSDYSGYITGENLNISGGMLIK